MIDIDQNTKLAKFKKIQIHLRKDVEKKNKPKMWEEIDDLEKQDRQVLCSDDEELSMESKKKIIRNQKLDKKQFKSDQIQQYDQALKRIRKEEKSFHNPYQPQKLKMDIPNTIRALRQAKDNDKDIPLALKKVGIKSMKTLYIGGAKKQFDLVLEFLEERRIPEWIFQSHRELLEKKPHQFNGTVKGCLRP